MLLRDPAGTIIAIYEVKTGGCVPPDRYAVALTSAALWL